MPKNPKIEKDPDFIISKIHQNSLAKVLEKNPNGVCDEIICKYLQLTEEEAKNIHKSALEKLKEKIK